MRGVCRPSFSAGSVLLERTLAGIGATRRPPACPSWSPDAESPIRAGGGPEWRGSQETSRAPRPSTVPGAGGSPVGGVAVAARARGPAAVGAERRARLARPRPPGTPAERKALARRPPPLTPRPRVGPRLGRRAKGPRRRVRRQARRAVVRQVRPARRRPVVDVARRVGVGRPAAAPRPPAAQPAGRAATDGRGPVPFARPAWRPDPGSGPVELDGTVSGRTHLRD